MKIHESSEEDRFRQEMNRLCYDAYDNISYDVDKLDERFRKETGLSKAEVGLLTIATSLQLARILLLDNMTKIERAGTGNKNEEKIHKMQESTLSKLDRGDKMENSLYYASNYHIITNRGVPYDATSFKYEKMSLFKDANHRFATLGHDPVLGIIFGTANILTNTITCIDKKRNVYAGSYHVEYDQNNKNPKIAEMASTVTILKKCAERFRYDKESVVAAVIKQICHIGTDLYTPCGIQLPMANVLLRKDTAEKITKILSFGDVFKYGSSNVISSMIDVLISVLHALIEYDKVEMNSNESYRLFEIRNRKILENSKWIATGSNTILSSAKLIGGVSTGNGVIIISSIKDLDWGGIHQLLNSFMENKKFTNKVKMEFYMQYFEQKRYKSGGSSDMLGRNNMNENIKVLQEAYAAELRQIKADSDVIVKKYQENNKKWGIKLPKRIQELKDVKIRNKYKIQIIQKDNDELAENIKLALKDIGNDVVVRRFVDYKKHFMGGFPDFEIYIGDFSEEMSSKVVFLMDEFGCVMGVQEQKIYLDVKPMDVKRKSAFRNYYKEMMVTEMEFVYKKELAAKVLKKAEKESRNRTLEGFEQYCDMVLKTSDKIENKNEIIAIAYLLAHVPTVFAAMLMSLPISITEIMIQETYKNLNQDKFIQIAQKQILQVQVYKYILSKQIGKV